MVAEIGELRTAHCEGHTEICFDETGSIFFTAGADGDVRIYHGMEDDSEKSIKVNTKLTALAVKGDLVTVGSSHNEVVKVNKESSDGFRSVLLRFTAQINDIHISKDGKFIAAASSDFSIKMLELESSKQKTFNGHEAPVLSVAINNNGQFLASTSCDGTLRIWDAATEGCVKTMKIFPQCNDVSTAKTFRRVKWCPGTFQGLAVACGKGIKVLSSQTWEDVFNLKEEHDEFVSAVCWSPGGAYLATATINGEIFIWDSTKKAVIERLKHETSSKICALDWNPTGKPEICYTDDQGQFGLCTGVSPSSDKAKSKKQTVVNDKTASADNVQGIFDDDLDVDMPSETRQPFDDDDDDPISLGRKRHKIHNAENFLDDEADENSNDSNDPNISLNLLKEGFLPSTLRPAEDESAPKEEEEKKKPKLDVPQVVMQKAFQPSATPSFLMHRFMLWNSVGIIRGHSEDEIASIEIEFHDTRTHHPLHLDNSLNFTMAALSSRAVAFASEAQEDEPSKLQCLPLETWDSTKEWTVSMPKHEEIVAIAVNRSVVAAVTNLHMLRLFTIGGIQSQLLSIPGPVVSMAMHDRQLIIVYHQGSGLPNCQCLGVKLLDINGFECRSLSDHQLPLSHKAKLSWLGFSDEGSPVTVDSKGIVRMLQGSQGSNWTPIFDLNVQAKSKSDTCWVIGASESPPQIRYILCKGAQFPVTVPRPIPSVCSYTLALCEATSEKTQLEEEYLRSRYVSEHEVYKQRKFRNASSSRNSSTQELALLMKMFALACKAGREFRALEICELMPNAQTVSLAIQYATKVKKMKLAQRLDDLARRKAQLEEEAEEDQMEEGSDSDVEEIPTRSRSGRSQLQSQVSVSGRHKGSGFSLRTNKASIKGHNSTSKPLDDDMDDSENEMMSDNEEKPVVQKTNGGFTNGTDENEHLFASPQMRRNPFKLAGKGGVSVSVTPKGTSFFDTLKSSDPPQNKSGPKTKAKNVKEKMEKPSKKQRTIKTSIPKEMDKKNSEEIAPMEWITGFKLFLKETTSNVEEADPEDIRNATEAWRALDRQEKKVWNEKADTLNAAVTSQDSLNSSTYDAENGDENQTNTEKKRKRSPENTEDNKSAKKKIVSSDSTSNSKSKIANFAFAKN